MKNIGFIAARAQEVSKRLALFSTEAKNSILEKIARSLEKNTAAILKANAKDVGIARKNGKSENLLDRLSLTKERIIIMISEVKNVIRLNDPVGQLLESSQLPNGLFIKRVRVPLGVIGMICEARPNVTIDSAALSLKSGNALILKSGSDAAHTNKVFMRILQKALKEASFSEPQARLQDAVQMLDEKDREALKELLQLHGLVDVIIPRGGKGLIDFVRENAKVPVIETGASVVHTYVHEDADLDKAVQIILNAKLRRLALCNTLDSLLLDSKIAAQFLAQFVGAAAKNSYGSSSLELRADSASFSMLAKISAPKDFRLIIKKAKPEDFAREHLDAILSVRVVDGLGDALEHISRYSLKHSEAIITENAVVADRFLKAVDAACVYWNASTQFTDGAQFGLGAEIGISTQKLHVRGPFALEGLTSYKWIIEGNGQIRP